MAREQTKHPLTSRSIFDFQWFRTPTIWQDLETWPTDTGEATGLTVFEEGDNLVVEAELPGLSRDSIDITYNKGVIDIRADQQEEEKSSDKKYYRKSSRSFRYRVSLPLQIDETKEPAASYQNGVLTLRFSKAQKGSMRQIKIQS